MSSLEHRRRVAPTPATHPALDYRHEGRRWRGKLPVPRHAHPFVRRVVAELNRQDMTMAEASAEAGLHKARIRTWCHHANPRIDELEAVLNVMGLSLAIVPRDPGA